MVEINPDISSVLKQRGISLHYAGRFDLALQDFNNAAILKEEGVTGINNNMVSMAQEQMRTMGLAGAGAINAPQLVGFLAKSQNISMPEA